MYISISHSATAIITKAAEWWQMCDSFILQICRVFPNAEISVFFFNLIKPLMNILSNELHVLYFIIYVVYEALH